MNYKLGLKPPRLGAIQMRFAMYATPALPKPPAEFGHDGLVSSWHLLGNDTAGCCFWSGAAHETYLWTAEGGERTHITTNDVLDDYGAATGFDPAKPETDQGTDMEEGASYRRKTGILDATGSRHKIGAYVEIEAGNLAEHLTAAYLFSAVGLGIQIGDNQQDQFSRGVPWDGPLGSNVGGHYVNLIAYRNGMLWCVTWGKLQAISIPWFLANNDQSIAYFSPDFIKGGKSPDGFDQAAVADDLNEFTRVA